MRLTFNTVVDIDTSIGIVNKQTQLKNGRSTGSNKRLSNGRFANSTFSGIYKVLTVRSTFNRGQFTQVLDLVRMPDDIEQETIPNENKNEIQKVQQNVLDKIAPAARPGTGVTVDENLANAPDPRLVAAAQGATVSVPAQNPGAGTPTQVSQTVDAAPRNSNNALTVSPQQTAPVS